MIFRKVVFAVFFAVTSIAITFSGCATMFGGSEPNPGSQVDFGIQNDVQNGESMGVNFNRSMNGQFVFECSYRGSRRPDTLLLRIDNGSPITLRISNVNSFNPGLIEFAISNDVVNQLLNCNNSIDLEFTAPNPPSDYVRKWHISSEADVMEMRRAQTYGGAPRLRGPLGVKNFINYWNSQTGQR